MSASCVALIDSFHLRVELESNTAGFAEGGGARPFKASERRIDKVSCGGPVHLDRARLNVLRETVDIARIACGDRCGESILSVVRFRDSVAIIRGLNDCEHWS